MIQFFQFSSGDKASARFRFFVVLPLVAIGLAARLFSVRRPACSDVRRGPLNLGHVRESA